MCAGTVVAPPGETSAGIVSTTSRSRSVAFRPSLPFSARISRFAKIGIVLRRSTTRCTCPIDLRSAARSTVTFISDHTHAAGSRRRAPTLPRRRGFGKAGRALAPTFPHGATFSRRRWPGHDPGHRAFRSTRKLLLHQALQGGGLFAQYIVVDDE